MAGEFCDKCTKESTDETAGSFTQGMFGREFMGEARRCADCNSWVATLWQVFLYFPLTPIGSYRYKTAKIGLGGTRFYSRKVPLDQEQVRSTRISGSIVAAIAIAVAVALIYWRSHR
jgi:hypothetical protein